MTRVICVASGKGGVGKTTSVVNLGYTLNKFGYDTIIIDANLGTPNLSLHLGMPKVGVTLHDVLASNKSIYESVYVHPNGIKIVPAGMSMYELSRRMNKKLGKELLKLKGVCDIVLLDCSAGIKSEARTAIKAADELLIITNPDLPSITDAFKTIEISKSLGVPVIGFILNKHRGRSYEITPSNIEEFLGIKLLSIVPDDEYVKISQVNNNAVVDYKPNCKASIGFKKAAAKIVGQDYKDLEDLTIFERAILFFRKFYKQ